MRRRRILTAVFVAAWVLGAVATAAGQDGLLVVPGAVLIAFGAWALRSRATGGLLAWVAGVDLRGYRRLAGALILALGVAWVIAGVTR